MIIFDFSQIALSNYFKNSKLLSDDSDGTLFKNLILNSIRSYFVKYKKDYGNDVVIAVDASNSWRKEYFPEYKAARKTKREQDSVNWDWVFGVIGEMVSELDSIFPYRVIKVERAEADDVIGVLTFNFASETNPVMIISSDGDFKQLQMLPGVKQFAPAQNKEVIENFPGKFLQEKILRGDPKDGVPNFLSPDRVFVDGGRQKPIRKKEVEEWLSNSKDIFEDKLEEVKKYYERNSLMIDLSLIPNEISEKILSEYYREHTGSKNAILSYFTRNRMKELSRCLDEF